MYWKKNNVTCCISTQSDGVLILFDNSFGTLESHRDNNGRKAIAVIEKDDEKLIILNLGGCTYHPPCVLELKRNLC